MTLEEFMKYLSEPEETEDGPLAGTLCPIRNASFDDEGWSNWIPTSDANLKAVILNYPDAVIRFRKDSLGFSSNKVNINYFKLYGGFQFKSNIIETTHLPEQEWYIYDEKEYKFLTSFISDEKSAEKVGIKWCKQNKVNPANVILFNLVEIANIIEAWKHYKS